jgi:5'-methylthioadenosine phosphorylase
MTEDIHIGVIGGSGLYDMPQITDRKEHDIDTPFGKPSAPLMVGTLGGKRVAFVPRHGKGHYYTPSTVPYRANIYALKSLGVKFVIAVSACGSLREAFEPGHIVIPHQLYDNTKLDRGRTFFEAGLVGHVSVADPFDDYVRHLLTDAVREVDGTAHDGGLFITVEGPRFSTKGESHIFRRWGCDIIGMTTSPEAFLAAEAEMAYAVMAHITDYDVWHETEENVSVEAVLKIAQHNIEVAKKALPIVVERLDTTTERPVHNALNNALMTRPDLIPTQTKDDLAAIVSRHIDV